MSEKTAEFEKKIASKINIGDKLPQDVKKLSSLGVQGGAKVTKVSHVGSSGEKTDIEINFDKGPSLKISVKMNGADFFGNWYSHKRIINDFNGDIFSKLTKVCTEWANEWIDDPHASFFVGVSISFGRRGGKTWRKFTDIFKDDDINIIVKGANDISANCLLAGNYIPNDLEDLIDRLEPLTEYVIKRISDNFKIIFRPINPMTEGSNRSKCIYTQFVPFKKQTELTTISSIKELKEYGTFCEVECNSINHNTLIKKLKDEFNIQINVK